MIEKSKNVPRFYRPAGAVGLAFCLIAAVVWLVWRPSTRQPAEIDSSRFRPPGEPGQPYRETTPDHQFGRVMHKDASGLSPLEVVSTPEGMVTIQRTFNDRGDLLKEEAKRNGQQVPVPRR